MKKLIFSMIVALMATVVARAQQIAVVSDGTTTLYHTLQEAIEGAPAGSVIYLPGGGFSISKTVKITKKLTFIGIGYYAKSGNVDGITTISGDLRFYSDGSAIMGCYITGEVLIADYYDTTAPVNDIIIKYCNVGNITFGKKSNGTIIAQNYVRGTIDGCGSEVTISNNITASIVSVGSGKICDNIITKTGYTGNSLGLISNTTITGNIICAGVDRSGSNPTSDNLVIGATWGENNIEIDADVEDLFEDWNNGEVSPTSNFHFKEAYKEYESKVGIYAGSGFNDKRIAPVPYIVAKHIEDQTDASGMLKVNIRVSAGE